MPDNLKPESVTTEKRLFILIVSLVAVFVLYSASAQLIFKPLNHRMHEQIQEFYMPEISLFTIPYQISESQVMRYGSKQATELESFFVLRIARLYTLAKFDGIFAIDGTGPQALYDSVENFNRSLMDFAPLFPDNERDIILTELYPIDFLLELAETQGKRVRFFEMPSLFRAISYYRTLDSLIDAYKDSLERAITLIEERVLSDAEHTQYTFIFGTTDGTEYRDAFQVLLNNGTKQKEKVVSQFLCIIRDSITCNPRDAYDTLVQDLQKYSRGTENEALEKDVLNNRSLIIDYKTPRITDNNSHIYKLNESVCLKGKPTYYLAWTSWLNEETEVFKIDSLNDLYFYDTGSLIGDFFAMEREVADVSYANQSISNNYMCPELAYDQNRVHAYNIIREMILKWSIPTTLKDYDYINILKKRILSGDITYESDIHAFIRSLSEDENRPTLESKDQKKVEDFLVLTYQMSPEFHTIIGGLITDNAILKVQVKVDNKFTLGSFITSRAYFATLFLAPNKTFSDTYTPFMSKDADISIDSFRLRSWKNDLSNQVTVEEIKEENRKHRAFFIDKIDYIYTTD